MRTFNNATILKMIKNELSKNQPRVQLIIAVLDQLDDDTKKEALEACMTWEENLIL